MKKLIMFAAIALCAAGINVNAQKPTAGTFETEILLNPWNDGGETFSLLDGVKGRYFISDKMAVRATLNFGFGNTSNEVEAGGVTTKTKGSASAFGIAPGIEFHFGNWDKVSLYGGAEIGFNTESNSSTETVTTGSTSVETKEKNVNPTAWNSIGVAAFTGVDYYFSENLYMGAEFGLAFASRSQKDGEITVTGQDKVEVKNNSTQSGLAFYCLPSVRIGWKF